MKNALSHVSEGLEVCYETVCAEVCNQDLLRWPVVAASTVVLARISMNVGEGFRVRNEM